MELPLNVPPPIQRVGPYCIGSEVPEALIDAEPLLSDGLMEESTQERK